MVIFMVMLMVNVHEAKARLSEYLDAAQRGERVLICRRNRPVAELTVVRHPRASRRPIGGATGRLRVPPAFFESLPDALVDAFAGEAAAEAATSREGPSHNVSPLEGPPPESTSRQGPRPARLRRPRVAARRSQPAGKRRP
jgi:prevent-host-death family protein